MTVPRVRITARASPTPGWSWPMKLMSTGWLTVAALVRVKLRTARRTSARGRAVDEACSKSMLPVARPFTPRPGEKLSISAMSRRSMRLWMVRPGP